MTDAGKRLIAAASELVPLPCPFCGRDDPAILNCNPGGRWSVHCRITGCYGSAGSAWTREKAIEAWNTRANPPHTTGG